MILPKLMEVGDLNDYLELGHAFARQSLLEILSHARVVVMNGRMLWRKGTSLCEVAANF